VYRPIEKNKKLGLEIKRSKKGARLLIESERKRNKRKAIGHVRVTSQKVGRTRSSISKTLSHPPPPPPPPPHEKSLLLYCSPAALIYLLFLSPAQPFSESNPKRDGSVPTFSDVIYTHPKRPARKTERERAKSIIKWGASGGGGHIYIYFLGWKRIET
jgi:hypothetical protein